MASIEELQKKQADTAKYAMKMVGEEDPERIKEMTEVLQQKCKELEKMARGMEAALTPNLGEGKEVTVVLTPDQKKRLAESTKVGIETVTLRDTKQRMWSKDMPKVEPREIEKQAALQAAASRLQSETRSQVEKIIKQLEALGVPELEETIANLRKDPTLGLAKKGK